MATYASRAETFTESFTGTTAPGWIFDANPGDTLPVLTATTVDTPGNGWLRLNTNTADQSTSALLNTEIFSVNAQVQIEMEYSFFNGTGADGITFFLVDGTVDASTFTPGAYGGSMGYAQKNASAAPPTGEAGMPGGYLGFAFDNWGNYTNNNEGRVGGVAGPGISPVDTTLRPNRIAVRGPESSDYAFIASSADLSTLAGGGQMDFPTYTSRPVQTGADYRQFRLTIDANNQLIVEMKFGASASYITAFTADLSAYERPDTFKIGFTGATGGANEIHEIRNLTVTTTPWSSGSGAYEWDNNAGGTGSTAWGGTPGGANTNWYSSVSGNDDKTPLAKSDVLFGNKPTNNGADNSQLVDLSANVEVRNLTIDSGINYTIGTSGDTPTITFGKNISGVGLPSINVNNYNDAYARHKINSNLVLAEDIAVRNFSFSTLCINGTITTGGNDITTSGYGATNFNGVISGTGDFIANGSSMIGTGSGIVTISGDNAATWSGDVTVNGGQLVVLHNNALGATGQSTVVNDGGTLTFRGGISTAEPLTIRGSGTTLGRGELGGALFNDGGANTLSGAVTLGANATVRSRDGNLTLSGLIEDNAGTYSLTKLGDGVVTLSNSGNGYDGSTIISGGALRITTSSDALVGGFATGGGSGGNLTLSGGVLEIGVATTFNRQVGTAADQVNWDGDGGFSAFGGARTVTLVNPAEGDGRLVWASTTGFLTTGEALLLSSDFSDNTVTLTNQIRFNGAQREIRVADGSAAVDAVLSGRLRGVGATTTGGLIKTGSGTLELSYTGTDTDYSGATEIRDGALRVTQTAALSVNSNLQLNGGVFEVGVDMNGGTAGDYSARLGTSAGRVQWTGSGGFSAGLADRSLSLTNSGGTANGTLVWNAGSFVADNQTLILGSNGSGHTLTLTNVIDLGASTRDIRVVGGTNTAIANAVLSGAFAATTGGLNVTGNGRLDLTAANAYTGATTVTGADLRLNGTGGALASTAFTVRQGGTLTLDSTTGTVNSTRIADTATLSLSGGSVVLRGNNNNNTRENLGALTLSGGANTLDVLNSGTGDARLSFTTLTRSAGATLDVLRPNANSDVEFRTTAPALTDGILAYATINGADFATHSGAATDLSVATYSSAAENLWTSSDNFSVSATTTTLSGSRSLNSLRQFNGSDLDLGGHTLTVDSGGILAARNDSSAGTQISNGTLTTGNSNDLIVHAYHNGSIGTEISATLAGTGGLTKSGTGTLTLSGASANTLAGTTTVNSGTLALDKTDGVTAVAGNLTVGDGRGVDTVRLDSNEQIADTATVTLVGGEVGNAANVARLELNGATSIGDPVGVESFSTLSVTGNSVLDFGDGTVCSPTFLYIDVLNVAANTVLTIEDWIEFTDFFLVKKTSLDTVGEQDQLARVVFDGYGGSASWEEYDSQYYQIVPYSPVPEPATYGLLTLGGLTAFAALRRRRVRITAGS